MVVRLFQKAVSYIKDIQDIGLFGVMTDSRLFAAFSGSPFYYVMLPFIGILLTILAVLNGYQLALASNKNFDKWFGFIVSGISAVCSSVSLYGAVIATAMGVSFAIGPWLFLGSVLLVGVHQGIMLGLNAYRAYESLAGSSQRMHYIQAILSNAFFLGLLTAISGAITFVMLTPVAPVLGTVCAAMALMLTALNILWRITPDNWKLSIKGFLHLGKPELINEEQLKISLCTLNSPSLDSSVISSNHRLFTQIDYSALIKSMDLNTGVNYLKDIIARKIEVLSLHSTPKNDQKSQLLEQLVVVLADRTSISKSDVSKQYPLAFQSFWAEKGEIEQIFDAVMVFLDKHEDALESDVEQQVVLTM